MISSHVTYQVSRARMDDLRSQADEGRRARRDADASRPATRSERRQHGGSQPLRALTTLRLRRA